MRHLWIAVGALALGGCGLFGDAEPRRPARAGEPAAKPERTEPVPEPVDSEAFEGLMEGIKRWRESLIKGDFETHLDATSLYCRAQWILNMLDQAAAAQAIPRADELTPEQAAQIDQWRREQTARILSQDPMRGLPGSFLRLDWTRNVLRDYFDRHWRTWAAQLQGWTFSQKVINKVGTEAWFLVMRPGDTDAIFYMVREEQRWRFDRLVPAGGR
jgi:hypothetical protein